MISIKKFFDEKSFFGKTNFLRQYFDIIDDILDFFCQYLFKYIFSLFYKIRIKNHLDVIKNLLKRLF